MTDYAGVTEARIEDIGCNIKVIKRRDTITHIFVRGKLLSINDIRSVKMRSSIISDAFTWTPIGFFAIASFAIARQNFSTLLHIFLLIASFCSLYAINYFTFWRRYRVIDITSKDGTYVVVRVPSRGDANGVIGVIVPHLSIKDKYNI